MRLPHTLLNESFRLQFPFVFRQLQSLQLLLLAHPCFLASLGFRFHGLSPLPLLFLTPAVFAPFRSLQFWVLTTQPLCFLSLLPVFASQRLSRCCHSGFPSWLSPFSPAWFPVHSFPVPGTQLSCLFPFALPRFAPTAVPRVLAFFSAFASFPAFSVLLPLSFVRFRFPSGYLAFCFFLSVLPVSASQWLIRCCLSAFASWLPPFFPAWFPVHSFPVFVLGFLLVSFRPALLRSRSCSTGDPLLSFLSGAGA